MEGKKGLETFRLPSKNETVLFCGNFNFLPVTLICSEEETDITNTHGSSTASVSYFPAFPFSLVTCMECRMYFLLKARADQKHSVCYISVQLGT